MSVASNTESVKAGWTKDAESMTVILKEWENLKRFFTTKQTNPDAKLATFCKTLGYDPKDASTKQLYLRYIHKHTPASKAPNPVAYCEEQVKDYERKVQECLSRKAGGGGGGSAKKTTELEEALEVERGISEGLRQEIQKLEEALFNLRKEKYALQEELTTTKFELEELKATPVVSVETPTTPSNTLAETPAPVEQVEAEVVFEEEAVVEPPAPVEEVKPKVRRNKKLLQPTVE